MEYTKDNVVGIKFKFKRSDLTRQIISSTEDYFTYKYDKDTSDTSDTYTRSLDFFNGKINEGYLIVLNPIKQDLYPIF